MSDAQFAILELVAAAYFAGIVTMLCVHLLVDMIKTQKGQDDEA